MAAENFHKDVFERIPDSKRERIFRSAMQEFAKEGYTAANINTIAGNAGISIGSMYTYFPSKENLYLAISECGVGIFQEIIEKLSEVKGFYAVVERLFEFAIQYSSENKDISRMYLELTTHQMNSMSERLADKMELDFRDLYTSLLLAGQQSGEVRADVDVGFAAKFIDDCVVSLQYGASVNYYQLRQRQYLGENMSREQVVANMMDLVRRYLAP